MPFLHRRFLQLLSFHLRNWNNCLGIQHKPSHYPLGTMSIRRPEYCSRHHIAQDIGKFRLHSRNKYCGYQVNRSLKSGKSNANLNITNLPLSHTGSSRLHSLYFHHRKPRHSEGFHLHNRSRCSTSQYCLCMSIQDLLYNLYTHLQQFYYHHRTLRC
jgi:hypothetical protein